MPTNTEVAGYDPTEYPAFAVTVDVIVLSVVTGEVMVLLVRRGGEPFKGSWALPGGFKLPTETLAQAAARELHEETSIVGPALLRQLGAYGDPGRDPRMNVVTVAFLAVAPEVVGITAGTDADDARLHSLGDVIDGRLPVAFDHRLIVADAGERVANELETSGLALGFVPAEFTLTQLREVFEAVWNVRLDGANFRRRLTGDGDWVHPTGRRATPGVDGGKPAELYTAGNGWTSGGPLRRPQPEKAES